MKKFVYISLPESAEALIVQADELERAKAKVIVHRLRHLSADDRSDAILAEYEKYEKTWFVRPLGNHRL